MGQLGSVEDVSNDAPEFIKKLFNQSMLNVDTIYISVFVGREDGTWDHGTSKYENEELPRLFQSGY